MLQMRSLISPQFEMSDVIFLLEILVTHVFGEYIKYAGGWNS